MKTFTAQELADFYQKVADGGVTQLKIDGEWSNLFVGGPSIGSSKDVWRIKPTEQVIDLSVLIDSQIDCEFSDSAYFHLVMKRSLIEVREAGTGRFRCELRTLWKHCRPRMNHIHAWQGGDCPLPDGFMVKVCMRDDSVRGDMCSHFNWKWSYKAAGSDIIAFEVLGLADGYVMPWEQDNE